MRSSQHLPRLTRTRSHRSVFTEEFDSQHSLPCFDLELGDMASSPTPREIRRLASDHAFVLGAHPSPRRLGWWPFVATHLSLVAALGAGIIFVVVAIVYTSEMSKQVFECPPWANSCRKADAWTIEHLGTVQGIITMIYLIGMFALAYVALGLCETTVWPLLHMQSFTLKGLDAYLSTIRGSIISAPGAARSVRSAAAGFILASALVVTLLPFAAPPLVGHAYSPTSQPVQLESNYTPGGGIGELYAQTNPPTSVIVALLAKYNSWATNPASEPMPEHRDWYIDREALEERGDFTARAVRLQTTVSCRPHQVQQLAKDNLWWNAFLTNMTRTNTNSTQVGEKNSSAEVWIRPEAQLTLWADDFELISDRRTRTTLVFAALNGAIEGGSTTLIVLGNLTSVSSIACDVEIEAVDDILTVGTNPVSQATPVVLSSIDTLTLSPAAPPQTGLNELLLWLTVAPLLASTSVDGTQPMFTNSTTTGLPLAYTSSFSAPPNTNTWTIPGLTNFIRLSIGALAQSTTTSPLSTPNPPPLKLTTTLPLRRLPRTRILLLLLLPPPLLTLTLTLALVVYTTRLHAAHALPVLRRADLPELLKSAQTARLREVAGTDAAKTYLPSELGGVAVRYGVEAGVEGVAGLVPVEDGGSDVGERGGGLWTGFVLGGGKDKEMGKRRGGLLGGEGV